MRTRTSMYIVRLCVFSFELFFGFRTKNLHFFLFQRFLFTISNVLTKYVYFDCRYVRKGSPGQITSPNT